MQYCLDIGCSAIMMDPPQRIAYDYRQGWKYFSLSLKQEFRVGVGVGKDESVVAISLR
jgi:hypothetical protein